MAEENITTPRETLSDINSTMLEQLTIAHLAEMPEQSQDPKSSNAEDGGELMKQGEACLKAFQRGGSLADLEKSIEFKTKSIFHTPKNHPELAHRLLSLGFSYFARFRHTSNMDDLNKDIEYELQAQQFIPDGHPELPLLLHSLGESHLNRFNYLGDLTDLQNSKNFMSKAISLTLEGDPTLPTRLSDLGVLYISCFQCWERMEDLDKGIELTLKAVTLTPEHHPDLAIRFDNLGACYNMRFERVGDFSDLDKAIDYGTQSCSLRPEGDCDAYQLGNLAAAYSSRFHRIGNLNDLDKTIEYELQSCSLTSKGDPDLPTRLLNLCDSFHSRFKRLGDLGDLEKAIDYGLKSCALIPESQLNVAQLSHLGSAFASRFSCLGDHNDIEKAIQYHLQAYSLTRSDNPQLPDSLADLGASYESRFGRFGDLNDLDQSLEYKLRAHSLTPNDHPSLPGRLSSLSRGHKLRFQHLGDIQDLEKATEYQLQAYSLTPKDHPSIQIRLGELGSLCFVRFQRLGNLRDVDMAIEHRLHALSLTPDGHPDRARHTNDLASSYELRFNHLGDLGDLNKAIGYRIETCSLTPENHRALAWRQANLGASYEARFQRLGDIGDSKKAIEAKLQAYSLVPEGDPFVPFTLGLLGVSYFSLFQRSEDMNDLNTAINYQIKACSLTPGKHPDLAIHLDHLGNSYDTRFQYLSDHDDLNKAIDNKLQARSLISETHLEFTRCMRSLGLSYWKKHELLNDSVSLVEAKSCFVKAVCAPNGHAVLRFDSARSWARAANKLGDPDSLTAYHTAIELMPEVAWLGTTTSQRYNRIEQLGDVTLEATAAALKLSRPELALEWLEQGRSIVWNQKLNLQTPLDHLKTSHPSIADELETISVELHSSGSYNLGMEGRSENLERVIQRHHVLAKKYSELITGVRKLPGFSNFLKPKTVAELVVAAQTGPIVVISSFNDFCDALVVQPGNYTVKHIPLPNFSAHKAGEMCTYLNQTLTGNGMRRPFQTEDSEGGQLEGLLAILWNDVVKPIFEFLQLKPNNNPDRLPHITWCTTGRLSFLPLHAAGDYSIPHSNVPAHVISSYTPTLTALLPFKTRDSHTFDDSLLVVSQEHTPGQSSLPGTKQELACIRRLAKSAGCKYTEIINTHATTTRVLDAMERHSCVHLACHANQQASNPTGSGFYLHDGTLDLTTIMEKSFKNKGLAFLSACQTAQGDQKLPDEAAHLASGLLMAGYPNVIATMWSIKDEDAPFISESVYHQILINGEVCARYSAKALHNAVLELREKVGVENPQRWAQFIHIGS